jgi:hypothetical protein
MNILVYYKKSDSELDKLFEYLKKDNNDVVDYTLRNDFVSIINEFDFILMYKTDSINSIYFEKFYKINQVIETPPFVNYKNDSKVTVSEFQAIIPFAKALIQYGIKEKIILK